VHGGKGSVEQLSALGFKTQFGNYDSSSVTEIGKLLTEIHKNPMVNTDMTVHNFDRITDLEFLTSLVTAPLAKIAELINSIRR
jgi:tRNA A-37 threonylcarbamoyl transferase component Bud32